MTDNTKPEALDLADWLEAVGGGPSAKRCAALLREQHTRIAELEAQLEAIGAGGVEPLCKQVAPQTQAAPDERAAFEKWLRVKPCGAAHDFGWEAWRARAALAATYPTQQGLELANCKGGKWLTVVYRDIQPGDEARAIGEHPKVSALSWSHALHDRDAALAASPTPTAEQPDITKLTERGAVAWAGVDAQGLRDGVASAGSEPVAQLAAERDELFQAAIDFIRTLTGMEPPPIEVAPPEVFAPFHAFVNTVQAIINKRNSSPREGMVMVPKEPTHRMLNAAASAYEDARQSLGAYNAPWAAYRAMLEAAPPTTSAGSGKGE